MQQNIRSASISHDETKTLNGVEPFDRAVNHGRILRLFRHEIYFRFITLLQSCGFLRTISSRNPG